MADIRKVLGHGYGEGPGRGGLAIHQLVQQAETKGIVGGGGGGSAVWMTDAEIDSFMASYTTMIKNLTGNFTGYILDIGNIPLAAAMDETEKLAVQDMFGNMMQRLYDLEYTCEEARVADGWDFACGQGSTGDFAGTSLGLTWKKPAMAWARAVINNGQGDPKFNHLNCSVGIALAATNTIYFNFNGIHQYDALDNQGAPWTGFDVGHSCLGIDEMDVWLIPFPAAPTWYLKIFDSDLSLPTALDSLGTKIIDAGDTSALHEGDVTADPQIAPNVWSNHAIVVGAGFSAGDRFGLVCVGRSNRWAWDGGDANPSPTVPAFATAYGVVNLFTAS